TRIVVTGTTRASTSSERWTSTSAAWASSPTRTARRGKVAVSVVEAYDTTANGFSTVTPGGTSRTTGSGPWASFHASKRSTGWLGASPSTSAASIPSSWLEPNPTPDAEASDPSSTCATAPS